MLKLSIVFILPRKKGWQVGTLLNFTNFCNKENKEKRLPVLVKKLIFEKKSSIPLNLNDYFFSGMTSRTWHCSRAHINSCTAAYSIIHVIYAVTCNLIVERGAQAVRNKKKMKNNLSAAPPPRAKQKTSELKMSKEGKYTMRYSNRTTTNKYALSPHTTPPGYKQKFDIENMFTGSTTTHRTHAIINTLFCKKK